MTPDQIQATIDEEQRAITALQGQIQQAMDREQPDLIQGYNQQIQQHSSEVTRLHDELTKAQQQKVEQEKEEVAKQAREKQKKEDQVTGFLGF